MPCIIVLRRDVACELHREMQADSSDRNEVRITPHISRPAVSATSEPFAHVPTERPNEDLHESTRPLRRVPHARIGRKFENEGIGGMGEKEGW